MSVKQVAGAVIYAVCFLVFFSLLKEADISATIKFALYVTLVPLSLALAARAIAPRL